ncbi:uncharacterized protein UMAG_12322 [Mycosarcoma maydis]|uniref:Uncharacterized protein n=1 Tax=Mycosarcoma maydis TaxID=5270 RepID=A0A0D1CGB1_MYCMD|nr:uncharacterized protein UMAG_12322 [Ustilago maydis 521]KIS66023.1 hypothetical protein UMAG_12322 [Ustilago maydis 521]|eukprot:XP_011392523.1 hypothetical protein UMAG_12322 [Ustilago maydis 521]
MLWTGSILGQASAGYRKHVQNGNLIDRQVQYQGTDRRLCLSLSHYLSQRRRWGANAYINAFVTFTQQNQHVVTRIWMSLQLTRSTLVFFRMYSFAHFICNEVTKFGKLGVVPL